MTDLSKEALDALCECEVGQLSPHVMKSAMLALRDRAIEAEARAAAAEAKLAAVMEAVKDVRRWEYYPIEMPITADGVGPATVGEDAAEIVYEVWDRLLNSHASFDNLPDAINEAMRLNALDPTQIIEDMEDKE